MRILHTADWHLGHTLRDHSREAEHARFLRWLVATVVAREVDALLIAGDVFDAANPPPSALRAWFAFLGELKRARPHVQVVVIAGNHDSAARLVAPRELLAAFDVRVVGAIERDANGRLAVDDLLVPLRDRNGANAALCVAIPFLRSSDVLALAPRAPVAAAAGPDARPASPRAGTAAVGPERNERAAVPSPAAAAATAPTAAATAATATTAATTTATTPTAAPREADATRSARLADSAAPHAPVDSEPTGPTDCSATSAQLAAGRDASVPARAATAPPAEVVHLLPRPGESRPDPSEAPAAASVTAACAAATEDPLLDGMRALHAELFAAARAARGVGQALVAMAHGYLVGGALSELSERKVLGGNQHALPLDLFPPDCAYVALGHLHRPQPVGGREHVRYSGSPIPLSMPERVHAHHVVFADLDGERLVKTWSMRVPRTVPLVRLPEHGELEPDAALAAVAALPPRDPALPEDLRPFVEVAVRLPQPSPQIGERIARAIADRNARLVRVDVVLTGERGAAEPGERPVELASLQPEEVFVRRFRRDHSGAVPDELLAAFRQLLDDVEHGGGG